MMSVPLLLLFGRNVGHRVPISNELKPCKSFGFGMGVGLCHVEIKESAWKY